MNDASEAKLKDVMPELAARVRQLAELCSKDTTFGTNGFGIRVTQGLRSWNEQENLWRRGRMADGTVIDRHAIVTNCRGGHSYHNFGMALDLVPDDVTKDGFQCDWNADHPAWKRMETAAKALGLEVGAYWRTFPDAPHVQLTGRFPVGSPNDEVRLIFKSGGMQSVWEEAFK